MSRHWILADSLFDGTGGTVRHDMAIGIDGDRIVDVVPAALLGNGSPGETVRRLPGSTVLPGLIDAHVHLLFTCDADHERTRRSFEAGDDATLTAIGVRNAAEALLGGVTTVRDCGDTRGIVGTIRDAEQDGWVIGPRILSAGSPLTTPSGHLNWCGNVATTDAEVEAAVQQVADAGSDLLKVMASGGNMTSESDPLSAQFTDHQLELAVRTAHARGLRVAAHAQNRDSVTRSVHAGVDTIEHCLWRDAAGQPAAPEELIDLLTGRPSTVVLTFAGIQRALLSDATVAPPARTAALAVSPTGQLSSDFSWARQVARSGTPVAVASDAGVRFTPFRDFLDTVRCTVEAFECTPAEAVACSTGHAARAIGLDDEIGRVVPGMVADLTILQGGGPNQFGRVVEVLRNGRTVVCDDALTPAMPPTTGPRRSRAAHAPQPPIPNLKGEKHHEPVGAN